MPPSRRGSRTRSSGYDRLAIPWQQGLHEQVMRQMKFLPAKLVEAKLQPALIFRGSDSRGPE